MINEIIAYIEENPVITVISFDIFDTLLLRTVANPKQVFERMYLEDKSLFPEYTDEKDWRNARNYAEKTARKNAFERTESYEVSFAEIYEYLPFVYQNKEALMNWEIECEIQTCFVNEEMYETLKYIKRNFNLPVVLISDMYFDKRVISEILLKNGFDLELLDGIFVSCEYGVSKKHEKLYRIVLDEMGIEPCQMLHIGDNRYSDVGVARKLGIHTYFYPLISEAGYRYPYFYLENLIYGEICKEIYSLRILAASKNNEKTEEGRLFFDIGAMIIGPLFTYATEWVLNEAEKNDVKIIRPLMREGKFLAELLREASKARNLDISIEPLYVSRFAVFIANFEKCCEKDIKYLISTNNITLRRVFETLSIMELSHPYEEYLDMLTINLKNMALGEESVFENVLNYLLSDDVISSIRINNTGTFQKVIEYLDDMELTKPSITLDIGWRGSTQNTICKLLRENGYDTNIDNLLFFSRELAIENIDRDCRIRGFIGNWGKDNANIVNLFHRLVEMFCLNLDGTTVGYERRGSKIVPITQNVEYPNWQVNAVEKLQAGIKAFQREFLSLVGKKILTQWYNYRIELCNLMERLLDYPHIGEATQLSKMVYDQNFGAEAFSPMLSIDLCNKLIKEGEQKFYSKFRTSEIQWYSGMNVLADSTCYYEMILKMRRNYYLYSLLLMCKRAMKIAGSQKVVLVGGGRNAKSILRFLAAMNKLSFVEGIVDNDENIHGATIAGIKITRVEHQYDSNIYLCTITNKVTVDSLFKQVASWTEGNFKFISYFEEDIV